MAHEIMSVKLCELDDRVARLHSRLRLTETADAGTLDREIAEQKRQCAETALTLAQRLAHSKGAVARELSETYEKMESQLQLMSSSLGPAVQQSEAPADEQAFLAEYALDFALLAVERALLLSMQAIYAQQSFETEERNKR